MKKLLLVLAGVAILTVACRAEMNVTVDIHEDRSATATYEFGIDNELKSMMESNGGSIDGLFDELDPGTDDVEKIDRTDGNMTYTGAKVTFTDIDEMTAALTGKRTAEAMFDDFSLVMDDKSVELTTSVAAPEQSADDFDIDPSTIPSSVFTANLILKLPGTVVEHDADEVLADGSLRWDLPINGDSKSIHARAEFGKSAIPWLWIGIALILALILIAIVFTALRRKKRRQRAVLDATYPDPPSTFEQADTPSTTGTDGDGVDEEI